MIDLIVPGVPEPDQETPMCHPSFINLFRNASSRFPEAVVIRPYISCMCNRNQPCQWSIGGENDDHADQEHEGGDADRQGDAEPERLDIRVLRSRFHDEAGSEVPADDRPDDQQQAENKHRRTLPEGERGRSVIVDVIPAFVKDGERLFD